MKKAETINTLKEIMNDNPNIIRVAYGTDDDIHFIAKAGIIHVYKNYLEIGLGSMGSMECLCSVELSDINEIALGKHTCGYTLNVYFGNENFFDVIIG